MVIVQFCVYPLFFCRAATHALDTSLTRAFAHAFTRSRLMPWLRCHACLHWCCHSSVHSCPLMLLRPFRRGRISSHSSPHVAWRAIAILARSLKSRAFSYNSSPRGPLSGNHSPNLCLDLASFSDIPPPFVLYLAHLLVSTAAALARGRIRYRNAL